jgi:thioredoxin reductase (NADPH)
VTVPHFSLAVLGAGPAGLAAVAEARRLGCESILLLDESGRAGGAIRLAHAVRNVPFVSEDAPGELLARQLEVFSARFGVPVTQAHVHGAQPCEQGVELRATSGQMWTSRRLVVATGTRAIHPGTPGLPADFSFPWADSAANATRGGFPGVAAVVGAGDVAFDQARWLAAHGSRVLVLCRSGQPRAPAWLQRSAELDGVELLSGCELLAGEVGRSGTTLQVRQQGAARSIEVDRLVAAIGRTPALVAGVSGLQAAVCRVAGDATGRRARHVVAALGDGCLAASELLTTGRL